jgi:hypothetical protein
MRPFLLVAPFAIAGIVVGGVNPPAPRGSCSGFIEQESLPVDGRKSAGKPRLNTTRGISKLTHDVTHAGAPQAIAVTFVKERDLHVNTRGVDGIVELAVVGVAPSHTLAVAANELL